MIKVKDINGNVVRGVYRTPLGTLVVKDDGLLEKYKIENKYKADNIEKVKSLENDINDLKKLVQTLTERLK